VPIASLILDLAMGTGSEPNPEIAALSDKIDALSDKIDGF
jgi:hypothetical protein